MFGVCSVSFPTVASSGTVTFTDVGVVESGETPGSPPKSIVVVDASPRPVIVTVVPAGAESGENDVTFVIAYACDEAPVPPGVVTLTFPLENSDGTVVSTSVEDTGVTDAFVVPNVT